MGSKRSRTEDASTMVVLDDGRCGCGCGCAVGTDASIDVAGGPASLGMTQVFTTMLATIQDYCVFIVNSTSLDEVTYKFLNKVIVQQEFKRCFDEFNQSPICMKKAESVVTVLIACINDLRCSPRYCIAETKHHEVLDSMMIVLERLFIQIF